MRGHRGPRVVVRAAGRPEVDPAVAVVQRRRLDRGQGRGPGRTRRASRPRRLVGCGIAVSRSAPPAPAIVHGGTPGGRRVRRIDARQRRGRSRSARRRARAASGRPAARPRAAGRTWNRSPVSSVIARCEAHDVGKRAALGAEDRRTRSRSGARRRSGGGPCSTTTRSGGRAGRRRVAGPRGADRRRRRAWASGDGATGRGAVGLARIGRRRCSPRRSTRRRPARGPDAPGRRVGGPRRLIGAPPRPRPRGRQPARDEPLEGGRHPPVPLAQQPHRGRHEQRPDDGRVERHGDRHADARAP